MLIEKYFLTIGKRNCSQLELTVSICSRARAASFCSLSLAAFSCLIVASLLATLSLWRWPSSWFLMLAGLFDIKILQKSHHLLPWLTQYCKGEVKKGIQSGIRIIQHYIILTGVYLTGRSLQEVIATKVKATYWREGSRTKLDQQKRKQAFQEFKTFEYIWSVGHITYDKPR